MGFGGLTIPLPLGREVRVSLHERPAAVRHQQEHVHQGPDESRNVIFWIAYFDDEDQVARAVAPELSLVVERPVLTAAIAELELLIADYVEDSVARGDSYDGMLRLLPKDIIAVHMAKLTRMLQRHESEKGTAWSVGHYHVSHAPVPTRAT